MSDIEPISREQAIPVSFAQRRLWFISDFEGSNPCYNTPIMLRMRGDLNVAALMRAVNALIRRHEALRTRFTISDEEVVQEILPDLEIEVVYSDLQRISGVDLEETLAQHLEAEANRPFSLSGEPLVRAYLWQLSQIDHCLLINIHHIVTDGWSEGILFRELGVFYSEYVERPAPKTRVLASEHRQNLDYADFVKWELQRVTSGMYDRQLAYWKERLSGLPARLPLPFDRFERHADLTRVGGWVDVEIPQNLQIHLASQQSRTSLFANLATVFAAVLHHWSGTQDLLIGTPLANRMRPEWESVVGLFVNTAAVRVQVSDGQTLAGLLEQVQQSIVEAAANQEVPFDQVVDALAVNRSTGVNPVYQVMCTVNEAIPAPELPCIEVTEVQELRTRTAKFDLELKASYTDRDVRCWLEFPDSLFDESTVEGFSRDCTAVLSTLLKSPQCPLADLPIQRRRFPDHEVQVLSPEDPLVLSAPQVSTLTQLAAVWKSVLGIDSIGSASHFFRSGGNSLLATRLVLRIRKEWDIEPTVQIIFDNPVLSELAAKIDLMVREARDEDRRLAEEELANLSEQEIDRLLDSGE
ncbi:condensation domain-containing protein [Streptomyces bikiniensis]|uniref:Condensation domain-containing protein n=1 Tax=Streptomyces bikiniensis TaxID=1896 RepID=A0ABW8D1C3_STRBI